MRSAASWGQPSVRQRRAARRADRSCTFHDSSSVVTPVGKTCRAIPTSSPLRTSSPTAAISGDSHRSCPGPPDAALIRSLTAPVQGDGARGLRSARARALASSSMASTSQKASSDVRSLRAACQPIDTWSSCIPDDGIESTLAGVASRFISETSAACEYWAIMSPESTPAWCARNGARP